MKVYRTLNAIKHLTNIYEYIALNSPAYTQRLFSIKKPGPLGHRLVGARSYASESAT
jgi:hypothetical protein